MLHLLTSRAAPPSRRGFLMATLGGSSGLALGFALPESLAGGRAHAEPQRTPSPFAGYLFIDRNNTVTVLSAHMDMGQGIYHGIATLVAEELGVPVADIKVEGAAGNPRLYGNVTVGGAFQLTGGSSATPSSWERYRRAGATARTMLIAAAAKSWGVAATEVTTEAGSLVHASGKRATFGEMAEAASNLTVPTEVTLKAPAEWTQIGADNTQRVAGRDKVTGAFNFTIDIRRPGMLYAVVAHPPRFGGKVKSVDATAARKVAGVVDVITIARGVAIVARNTYAAIKGREALKIDWDETRAEQRGSDELVEAYRRALAVPGTIAAKRGDVAGALARASKAIDVSFEFPYLAHAALEPLDAVVERKGDSLEIWGGHQLPDFYQAIAAQIAGLTPDRVKMNVMPTGGGFGRRAVADGDVIAEATEIAKAIGWTAPVKLLWTREDDMRGGRYRPLYVHKLRASLGPDGRISAWHHHIVGQSIAIGTAFETSLVSGGIDPTSVEGAADMPYAVPDLQVEVTNMRAGVPVLWWRSVGHTHTAYAVETAMDELAALAGQDPVAFRLKHLANNSRERSVLEAVAAKAKWDEPLPLGRFRGVAVHKSFGTVVGMVIEITATGPANIKVERVVAAVDCGIAINPDVIRAQIEGGVGFGLGAILHSQITLTKGIVDQGNFDSYQVLRFDEMPIVEVHILPSTRSPSGIGEPGVPPVGPALANAVAAAIGKRVRMLPFDKGLSA